MVAVRAFGSQVDFKRIPSLRFVPESATTAPATPVDGQLWFDTSVHRLKVYNSSTTIWVIQDPADMIPLAQRGAVNGVATLDGTTKVPIVQIPTGTTATTVALGSDSRITGAEQAVNKGAASGYASLDAGTKVPIAQIPTATSGTSSATLVPLANDSRLSDQRVPTDGSVTGGTAGVGVKIAAATITDANVAAANKDGAAGVASLRTLGTGAFQATSGTDARLSDTRVPTTGSVVDASVSASAAIAETKLALATDAAVGIGSRRTLSLTSVTAAMPGGSTLNAIATANAATAALAMNNQKIVNLGAPTAANDAARLIDVQGAAAGIDAQPSVRVATTANVAIATGLVSGTVIDGVTLVTGDRVLLKAQTASAENGPYIVPAAGAAARATDSVSANTFWFAEEGTTQADTQWVVTTNNPITVGTTGLVITQFGASQSLSGTTNRITVTGGVVDIAATYTGQTSITTLGTITTGVWTGTAIAIANGGTGQTTAVAAIVALGGVRKSAGDMAALVAGVETNYTHNLNTFDVMVTTTTTVDKNVIDLAWRVVDVNTIAVQADVAYAAAAVRAIVVG